MAAFVLVHGSGQNAGCWARVGGLLKARGHGVAAPDLAKEFLFHDCDEETLSWALRTVELLDTRRLVTQAARFARWPSVPAVSIVATLDRTLSPDWGRRISRRVLGREAIEIQAGHCPHVSQPGAIADILERLAAREAA